MDDDKQKKIIAKNLNFYLKANDYQQKEVAKALDIKPATFSTWCTAQSMPSVSTLIRLAEYLKVNLTDLTSEHTRYDLTAQIEQSRNIIPNVPILGEVACGLPLFAEQNIIGYTYTDKKDHVDFALYANGDSMNAARIVDGDLVYIRQQNIVENGEIALILVDEDTATIKRFFDYGDKVVLRPDSFNMEHQEQVYQKNVHDIKIQGKIIFIKSFIK